jgi:uncharacterized membrane protein
MVTPRNIIIKYIEQGSIPVEKLPDALREMEIIPSGKSWRTFVDRLLLWLGGLSLGFALLFFIAYNWVDLGRFAKFGMVEGLIVLAIIAYCRLDQNTVAGKVSLTVATICLGVLLALFGQTYQTGADPWQLFFNWSLLMLPWAFIGRFSAIWIVWVVLINISIVLYSQTFRGIFGIIFTSETSMLWLLFIFNTLVFIAWELLKNSWHWLSERWAIRLLALGSGVPLTWLVLFSVFDYRNAGTAAGLVWIVWLASMFFIYRRIKPDLFMLAGICLSGITVIVSFVGKHMLKNGDAGAFLVLAILVIGLGGGAAFWLKSIHQECQS